MFGLGFCLFGCFFLPQGNSTLSCWNCILWSLGSVWKHLRVSLWEVVAAVVLRALFLYQWDSSHDKITALNARFDFSDEWDLWDIYFHCNTGDQFTWVGSCLTTKIVILSSNIYSWGISSETENVFLEITLQHSVWTAGVCCFLGVGLWERSEHYLLLWSCLDAMGTACTPVQNTELRCVLNHSVCTSRLST